MHTLPEKCDGQPHGSPADVNLRLALVHAADREPEALIAILVGKGLPPDAGVLSLSRIDELARRAPDAVVLAADHGHAEAARTIRRRLTETGIIVVFSDDARTHGRHTLDAGADAFLIERDAARALAPVVHAVAAGLVCVPRAHRRLIAKPAFTHREKEVMQMLVSGMTNRQIAERLYLAESTVKSHLASAFVKLGVRSRKDAVAIVLDPAEGLAATLLLYDAASVGARRLRQVAAA
jgi:DNA-binding NarL/FixJ family response regulator